MREELRKIVESQNRRNRRTEAEIHRRANAARTEADRLCERFRAVDPQIGTVILFGSLVTGLGLSERSDIDLAVESDRYLDLVLEAENSSFPVDVVDLRHTAPKLAAHIRRTGKVLYAKNA